MVSLYPTYFERAPMKETGYNKADEKLKNKTIRVSVLYLK